MHHASLKKTENQLDSFTTVNSYVIVNNIGYF